MDHGEYQINGTRNIKNASFVHKDAKKSMSSHKILKKYRHLPMIFPSTCNFLKMYAYSNDFQKIFLLRTSVIATRSDQIK